MAQTFLPVAMKYTDASGAALPTGFNPGTGSAYKYGTKVVDSHNAYNTSTGTYTVPVAGVYRVYATISTAAVTLSTSNNVNMFIYQNGVFQSYFSVFGGGTNENWQSQITDTLNCNAGDTIVVVATCSTSTTAAASSQSSRICIERVA